MKGIDLLIFVLIVLGLGNLGGILILLLLSILI